MKKIIIPKSFQLGPYTIKVSPTSDMAYRSGAVGQAFLNACEIGLQKSCEGYQLTSEQALVTYWHELFHWLFFVSKKQDLCNDEALCDMLAEFVVQIQKSSKGKSVEVNV